MEVKTEKWKTKVKAEDAPNGAGRRKFFLASAGAGI
jgi:hypothetical protein